MTTKIRRASKRPLKAPSDEVDFQPLYDYINQSLGELRKYMLANCATKNDVAKVQAVLDSLLMRIGKY